jgi:thiol-disulfide isomerase/thioredoxin
LQQQEQKLQQDPPQPEEQHDEMLLEGGRKPDWIVGRIFADWCGHCVQMKDTWNRLKKDMKNKKNGSVVLIDIQDMEMGYKLPKINKTYFQKGDAGVKSSGFPTIFMFRVSNPGNTLEYYKGARDYLSMKTWIENKMRRRKPAKMNRMKGGKKTKKMSSRKQVTRKVKKV